MIICPLCLHSSTELVGSLSSSIVDTGYRLTINIMISSDFVHDGFVSCFLPSEWLSDELIFSCPDASTKCWAYGC